MLVALIGWETVASESVSVDFYLCDGGAQPIFVYGSDVEASISSKPHFMVCSKDNPEDVSYLKVCFLCELFLLLRGTSLYQLCVVLRYFLYVNIAFCFFYSFIAVMHDVILYPLFLVMFYRFSNI